MWTAKKVHVIDKIIINFVTDLIHPHFISNFELCYFNISLFIIMATS